MSKKSKGGKAKHHGRGQAEGRHEPMTAAHVAARAQVDAECGPQGHCDDAPVTGEPARKAAIAGLEAVPGPGTFTEPVTPYAAAQFARPYLDAGHGAPAPQSGPPNIAPLPPPHPGVLTPVQLSAMPTVVGSGPVVQAMAQHQARASATMPPPPPARGQ